MRPIGFSTGALGYADFHRGFGLACLGSRAAIELSALRQAEWEPMLASLESIDVSGFGYVSVHAPSQFAPEWEMKLLSSIQERIAPRGWPVVMHPDAIANGPAWRELGPLLCIENMDKRKPIGRSVPELQVVYDQVPDASFCFDIGHARQCDTTMTEAYFILKAFRSRMRQVHLSEVNTRSKHDVLSYASILAFQEVAHLIPEATPIILETPVSTLEALSQEMRRATEALPVRAQPGAAVSAPGAAVAWSGR